MRFSALDEPGWITAIPGLGWVIDITFNGEPVRANRVIRADDERGFIDIIRFSSDRPVIGGAPVNGGYAMTESRVQCDRLFGDVQIKVSNRHAP